MSGFRNNASGSSPSSTEDLAHTSGDSGVMLLAVRSDAGGSLVSTDGDYTPLSVDANGNLRVTGSLSVGGTGDNSAFTAGTSEGTVGMGFYHATIDTVTDGRVAAYAITSKRSQHVTLHTAAGVETGVAATPLQVTLANGSVPSHAVTNAGTFAVQVDGNALTALQLLDNTVVVLGTATYTEATSSGNAIAAVRRDADTSLVNTDNEFAPLIVDARGFLKVEAFSGETLPVSLASVPSHAVTNAGTFAVQVDGDALTALQLIDDAIFTDDAAFTPTTSKGIMIMAQADMTSPDSVDEGDAGALRMTLARELLVQVNTALPTGANVIGALTANQSVNVAQVNGVTVLMGNGASGTGAQRVTLASDSTGNIATIGTSVTPGTAAANLGKARDSAIGATDTGIAMLGVRRDTPTAETPAAGDYIVPQYSANGEAWVRTQGELADDAAFTVGTTRVIPVGYLADSTSTDSVDEGDIGAARMTLDRRQIAQPYEDLANAVSGAITSAMTGTTSTSLVAAPGAGLRNYITTIICSNAHATVGTDIVIQDGSGGTTLLTIPAAAVYGGAVVTLPMPLRQPTANTALYCANVTTGASTKVSAVGFKAA